MASVACADVSALAQAAGAEGRAPLTWEAKHYAETGVKLEAPAGLCMDLESSQGFALGVHAIPPPRGVLDDTTCMVTIGGERMPKGEFEKQQEHLRSVVPDDEEQRKPATGYLRFTKRSRASIHQPTRSIATTSAAQTATCCVHMPMSCESMRMALPFVT
jgi:hypothetical protein